MKSRTLLLVAGVVGGLGIGIGAFGAHSLPQLLKDLPEEELLKRKEWLEIGVRYHMHHALAMLAVAVRDQKWNANFSVVNAAWLLGILLFSGSLYLMSVTGVARLGAVVPIGGVAFIVGWVALAVTGRNSA